MKEDQIVAEEGDWIYGNVESILRITMIVLLFRAIFTMNQLCSIKNGRCSKMIGNQQPMSCKKQQAELLRLVHDDYCGKTIEKDKAYIICPR